MRFQAGTYDAGSVEISISTRPTAGTSLTSFAGSIGSGIGGAGFGKAVSTVAKVITGGDVGMINGIESVSFGHSAEFTKVKGAGQADRGYTPGFLRADNASLEMHVDELFAWMDSVGGPKAFHSLEFDVTITYRFDGEPLNTVVLSRCRAVKFSSSHSMSSPDVLTATVEFAVLGIQMNASPLSNLLDLANNLLGVGNALGNLL